MTHMSTQPLITAGNHRISFGIFRTVGAGDESEDWTGLRVVDNNDRDFGGGIDANGDFEIARGFSPTAAEAVPTEKKIDAGPARRVETTEAVRWLESGDRKRVGPCSVRASRQLHNCI